MNEIQVHGEPESINTLLTTIGENTQYRESPTGEVYLCISFNTANCVGKSITKQQAIDKLVKDPIINAAILLIEYTPQGVGRKSYTNIVSSAAHKLPSPTNEQAITKWNGSGPVNGAIAINPTSNISALKNYYPRSGAIEFIYDPKSKTFVTGVIPPKKIIVQVRRESMSNTKHY